MPCAEATGWATLPTDVQCLVYARMDTRARSTLRVANVKPLDFTVNASTEDRVSEMLYLMHHGLKTPTAGDRKLALSLGGRPATDLADAMPPGRRAMFEFVDDLEGGRLDVRRDYGDFREWDDDTTRRVCLHLASSTPRYLAAFVALDSRGFLVWNMFKFCQGLRNCRHRATLLRYLLEFKPSA
jgi:hypothetical protein